MKSEPLLVALSAGKDRRVLRCSALDEEGFEVPDPGGLETGETVRAQVRTTAGGHQMHTIQARLEEIQSGVARFVFVSVPAPKISALARMATRCGVYRGSKQPVHRQSAPITATPFGAVDSVEDCHLVNVPTAALSRPEVQSQLKRGTLHARHRSAPPPTTPVAVRFTFADGLSQLVAGVVRDTDADAFWIDLPDMAPAILDRISRG